MNDNDTETSGAGQDRHADRARLVASGDLVGWVTPTGEVLPRMGGIALRNGLVLVSDDHWAAAVREKNGNIRVASGRKTHLPSGGSWSGTARRPAGGGVREGSAAAAGSAAPDRGAPSGPGEAPTRSAAAAEQARGAEARSLRVEEYQGLPLLRGLARFAETLLVVAQVKMRMPQAELPLEGGRVAMALATAFAATETVRAVGPKSAVAQEAGAAMAAFVPAVLSLKNSEISGYHGAEHKVIGGREAELRAAAGMRSRRGARRGAGGAGTAAERESGAAGAITASAAASAPKEHERCGSNLVGPLLLSTVAVNLLLRRGAKGRMSPTSQALAGAVSLGAALEGLRWATRHGDSLAARLMLSPGRLIQRTLTTSEPTPDQLEVAERAMKELLRLEGAAAW